VSYKRPQIHRVDKSQEGIVEDIEKAGWRVDVIGQPVDLLCSKVVTLEQLMRVTRRGSGYLLFLPLEAKTATSTGKVAIDKRQEKQIEFINATGTKRVTSGFEALLALGEKIDL
jgi:hypothetical protein